jgi:hypothetical protein
MHGQTEQRHVLIYLCVCVRACLYACIHVLMCSIHICIYICIATRCMQYVAVCVTMLAFPALLQCTVSVVFLECMMCACCCAFDTYCICVHVCVQQGLHQNDCAQLAFFWPGTCQEASVQSPPCCSQGHSNRCSTLAGAAAGQGASQAAHAQCAGQPH